MISPCNYSNPIIPSINSLTTMINFSNFLISSCLYWILLKHLHGLEFVIYIRLFLINFKDSIIFFLFIMFFFMIPTNEIFKFKIFFLLILVFFFGNKLFSSPLEFNWRSIFFYFFAFISLIYFFMIKNYLLNF